MSSLRSKIVYILVLIFILYGIVDFGIHRFIIYPSFLSLERDEAIKDSKRTVQAIQKEIYYINSLCHDWSSWDDTYDFVETLSSDYSKSNLGLSTFIDNKINLIYICNNTGKIIWGELRDLETQERIKSSVFSIDTFPEKHPLISFQTKNKPLSEVSISGVYMTDLGPMLISSRPVLNSNNEGPIRGTIMMGRFLTESIIKALVEQTHVDFRVIPVTADALPDNKSRLLKQITKESSYLIELVSDDRLEIYTTFNDINGSSALLIEAGIPRKIAAKGISAIHYTLYSVLAAGVCVLLLMILLLQKTVINPITKLTNHTLRVEKTGNLSVRSSIKSQDEIGILAREFDRMLEKLEEKNSELEKINEALKEDIVKRELTEVTLRESEAKYRLLINNHNSPIMLIGIDGLVLLTNDAGREHFGQTSGDVAGKSLYELVPDKADDLMKKYRQIIESGIGKNFEEVFEFSSEKKWFLSNVQPVRDSNGKIYAVQNITYNITEKKHVEEELIHSRELLRSLTSHLQSVRENERTRIAREIHDELGQVLTALKMDTYWLAQRLPKKEELLVDKTNTMSKLIESTISSVKRIITELRPGLLDDFGILAAIEWQAEEFSNRTGIPCEIFADPEDIAVDQTRSTVIFRIFQETLTNIARHANATKIDVILKESFGGVELKVQDNGIGITDTQMSNQRSFGLLGMRERVKSFGGTLTITGRKNKGTTIEMFIPIEKKEASND